MNRLMGNPMATTCSPHECTGVLSVMLSHSFRVADCVYGGVVLCATTPDNLQANRP